MTANVVIIAPRDECLTRTAKFGFKPEAGIVGEHQCRAFNVVQNRSLGDYRDS